MTDRINEDIRFYLPADPYYYQVDNLPLEDLLNNDIKLQDQIDAILASNQGVTVQRSGILELQPFVETSLPGKVSVRAGNFIGRTQRTSESGINGSTVKSSGNGIEEIGEPPTERDEYKVSNPPSEDAALAGAAKSVGRTAVFNYRGGNIDIDSFNYDDFNLGGQSTPPLGRIDLIGITTMDGALDSPYLPGNDTGGGVSVNDGYPRLAVVKGAGITTSLDSDVREVSVGEKFITIGIPQEELNDYGRDLAGNVVPNPTFGTVPSPDDIVNVCFSKEDVNEALNTFAQNNKNASFFLPLAYVYVPQNYVAGNPIPSQYLKDIRPLFRTAELTLSERQALAASENPSIQNPVVTNSQLNTRFTTEINKTPNAATIQEQINSLTTAVNSIQLPTYSTGSDMSRVIWNNTTISRGSFTRIVLNSHLDAILGVGTPRNIDWAQFTITQGTQSGDIPANVNIYAMPGGFSTNFGNGMLVWRVRSDQSGSTSQTLNTNSFIMPIGFDGNDYYIEVQRQTDGDHAGRNPRFYIYLNGVQVTNPPRI